MAANIILRWLDRRRRRRLELKAAAESWIERHGRYARSLASERSIDAYLLGDLEEQEVWSEVRERIDEERPGTTPGGEFPT
jgi:hypothetical protein